MLHMLDSKRGVHKPQANSFRPSSNKFAQGQFASGHKCSHKDLRKSGDLSQDDNNVSTTLSAKQ